MALLSISNELSSGSTTPATSSRVLPNTGHIVSDVHTVQLEFGENSCQTPRSETRQVSRVSLRNIWPLYHGCRIWHPYWVNLDAKFDISAPQCVFIFLCQTSLVLSHLCCPTLTAGMPDLSSDRARFSPNWISLGHFEISFCSFWLAKSKWTEKLSLKRTDLCNVCQFGQIWDQIWYPWLN